MARDNPYDDVNRLEDRVRVLNSRIEQLESDKLKLQLQVYRLVPEEAEEAKDRGYGKFVLRP
jgi:outer membrane murein-binding lipoprotein Lpp